MQCIEKIVSEVPVGFIFDSHYVIQRLIKDFSDDYLNFCANLKGDKITYTSHQQIGHQIAKLEGKLVKREPSQSWSMNIHCNGSECALWSRISPTHY